MITESDVRAVLTEQAHDISEPDDILARLTTDRPGRLTANRSWQRRWLAPVAAAAAVAAVVAGGVTLAGPDHKSHQVQPAVHTLPPMGGIEFQFVGDLKAPPHYLIDQPIFADDSQLSFVNGYGVAEIGDVTVYTKGAFDPSTIQNAQPVTIGRIHALFGTVMVTLGPPVGPKVVPTPTLAWQLDSGRWIAITGWWPSELALHHLHLDALTEAKKIAASIDTSVTRPFLIPFRVGYLPSGLQRAGGQYSYPLDNHGVMVDFQAAGHASPWVRFATGQVDDPRPTTLLLNGHPAGIQTTTELGDPKHPNKITNKTLDLVIYFDQSALTIQTKGVSRAELIKIGSSVSFASNINDTSTWFDAAK
jgi:hypothetical protein